MCTFQDEQTVLVCPVAIDRVHARLHEVFGEIVQFTTIEGQGTMVRVPPGVDSAQFQAITREAIAAAQAQDLSPF